MRDSTSPSSHQAIDFDPLSRRTNLAQSDLRRFFEAAVKFQASDLFMRGGDKPRIRLRGAIESLDVPPLEIEQFEESIFKSLTEIQWARYSRNGALDLSLDLDGRTRFRLNIYRTRGQTALTARRVNPDIADFDDLHLPESFKTICGVKQGLVLMVGVTGSGKSTTLAAMVNYINKTRRCHIITVEDPVEYLFVNDLALISQREVGIDVPSFNEALRDAMREGPDVILIGEMRDAETVEAALRAAETGHLVFGTIHASSASQAFGRMYDLFPPDERSAIRSMLAYQLHAFIYQKLLPTTLPSPANVPALELLLQSPPTRKYIIDGKEHDLGDVIKNYRDGGMISLTDSLVSLVQQGLIAPRVAIAAAPIPEELKTRLRDAKLI